MAPCSPPPKKLVITRESLLGVLEQLEGSPSKETGPSVHVDLSGIRFLTPDHQATLAAWGKAWWKIFPSGSMDITPPPGEAGSFAWACGLRAALENREEATSWSNGIPLRMLHNAMEADQAAERLGTLIGQGIGMNLISELIELFGEMLDNAVRHGASDPLGFIAAQTFPNKDEVKLCLVDNGIGIRDSFLVNGENQGRPIVEEGRSALLFATEAEATSKPSQHTGLGLFLAMETVRMNQGQAILVSGTQALSIRDEELNLTSIPYAWDGTCLSLTLRTDRPIPMDKANELVGEPHQRRYRNCKLDLAIYGKDLVTRNRGLAVRKDLALLSRRGPVLVDGSNLRSIGPSFLDEAFARPQINEEDPPLVPDLDFIGIPQAKLEQVRKLRG